MIVLLAAALAPIGGHASYRQLSFDHRQQIRARYTMWQCIDSGDVLGCLARKGFSCEPAADKKVGTYFCVRPHDLGRFEGTISCSEAGWNGRLTWVPETGTN